MLQDVLRRVGVRMAADHCPRNAVIALFADCAPWLVVPIKRERPKVNTAPAPKKSPTICVTSWGRSAGLTVTSSVTSRSCACVTTSISERCARPFASSNRRHWGSACGCGFGRSHRRSADADGGTSGHGFVAGLDRNRTSAVCRHRSRRCTGCGTSSRAQVHHYSSQSRALHCRRAQNG